LHGRTNGCALKSIGNKSPPLQHRNWQCPVGPVGSSCLYPGGRQPLGRESEAHPGHRRL